MSSPDTTSVLFVCLGNICRSPLAEGVFADLVKSRGLEHRYRVDSAGTGAWHVGELPDPRSREVARRNGVELPSRARQVSPSDLTDFDVVVAMDRSNLEELESLRHRGGGESRLVLMRDFDPEPGNGEVPDPYYGGPDGFDKVYKMVLRSAQGLLDELEGHSADG